MINQTAHQFDQTSIRRACFCITRVITLSFFVALLFGCGSTAPALNTASGKPEVSTSATTTAIKKAMELEMLNIGFILTSSQENTMTFEGNADKFTMFMNTNSASGAKPRARYRVNIIDMSTSRKVVLTKSNVMPGTPLNPSYENDVTLPSQLQEMQVLLQKVKATLEPTTAVRQAPSSEKPPSSKAAEVATTASVIAPPESMSIAEAQSLLTALGYQPGPADGAMGKRTVGALTKFQHDKRIPTSGKLDSATARALRMAKRPS